MAPTAHVRDEQGQVLATRRFPTDTGGHRAMVRYVHDQWPQHRWAVEGAHGVGHPLAQRLLAQGETVLDVPAKLAARVRVFKTGDGARRGRMPDESHTREGGQPLIRERPAEHLDNSLARLP